MSIIALIKTGRRISEDLNAIFISAPRKRKARCRAVRGCVCCSNHAVHAQNSPGPQPVAPPPPIVAPVDTPYPGTISLAVDPTNVTTRVLNVHETIPIKARNLTLLYPEWHPGTHSPSDPVANLRALWSRQMENASPGYATA